MASQDFDLGQLNESQQLALQQYMSVTDQEIEAAIPLLARSEWNVQVIVLIAFDNVALTNMETDCHCKIL